jgi:peroxiredoxin
MAKIKEGQLAIDFVLPDQNGKLHKLSDYKGKWILLYFYPKDDTPGCTKEACAIRDAFPNFKKLKRNMKQHEHYNITPNNTKYNFCVFSWILKNFSVV